MPPWGTPCPALPLFLPRRSLLFAPQPTPVIPSKGAETYKDLPRSRLGAGCFHVGVTFYRDIDTTSEFIFSLRDPEETSPRSRDPAILRPRQRVRRPPPPQGLSLPPFSTPPGSSRSEGARSRPGSSERRVVSSEEEPEGRTCRPPPGSSEPSPERFQGWVREAGQRGSAAATKPNRGRWGLGGTGRSGTPELQGAGRPAQPAAGAPCSPSPVLPPFRLSQNSVRGCCSQLLPAGTEWQGHPRSKEGRGAPRAGRGEGRQTSSASRGCPKWAQ